MNANANSSQVYTVRQVSEKLHLSQQLVNRRLREAGIHPLRTNDKRNSKKLLKIGQIVQALGGTDPNAVQRLFETE
jgi:hypothetical protein